MRWWPWPCVHCLWSGYNSLNVSSSLILYLIRETSPRTESFHFLKVLFVVKYKMFSQVTQIGIRLKHNLWGGKKDNIKTNCYFLFERVVSWLSKCLYFFLIFFLLAIANPCISSWICSDIFLRFFVFLPKFVLYFFLKLLDYAETQFVRRERRIILKPIATFSLKESPAC